jgi:molybdenum cofactor synthesis domain-containing protein
MIKAAILTVSDSCSRGQRQDLSGPAVARILERGGFEVCEKKVVADDEGRIADELKFLSDKESVEVVFTVGGTGLGPRDVTPEATSSVCERLVPGLSEIIRAEGFKKTELAVLSRAVAGVRSGTLIINLPGSEKGASESLAVILGVLPHPVEMMRGGGH